MVVIVSGLMGWADNTFRALVAAGFDCDFNRKASFIIVYDSWASDVHRAVESAGYGGGKETEID